MKSTTEYLTEFAEIYLKTNNLRIAKFTNNQKITIALGIMEQMGKDSRTPIRVADYLPATEKQKELLKKKRIPSDVIRKMSKEQASIMIGALLRRKAR